GVIDRAGRIETVYRRAAELVDDLRIARRAADEQRIPVELPGGRNHPDRLADDGAHYDAIAAGFLELGDLGGEIGCSTFIGRALGIGHADVLQAFLGSARNLKPEVIVLIERADFLQALVFDQPLDGGADLA